jgi:CRP/FNR family transcriptional regulator, cyclic AMP receptor protein
MTETRRVVPLLATDEELGRLLPPDRLAMARADLMVRLLTLPVGEWDTTRLDAADPAHLGLLVTEGIVAREVVMADTVSTELLGPGDVLRPWHLDDAAELLRNSVRWQVLAPATMALLDRRCAAQLARYPELNVALLDRVNRRAHRLATTQAISQLNRVDRRLLALFWHLAERWGRVSGEGMLVPMTLSHRMLGQLVGARRPTVSTALAELAESGQLERRDDGTWLIRGQPVGVPIERVEKVIPLRRRFVATAAEHEYATEEPPASELEEAGTTVNALRIAQLRATLQELRQSSDRQAEELRLVTTAAGDLCRRTAELRGLHIDRRSSARS